MLCLTPANPLAPHMLLYCQHSPPAASGDARLPAASRQSTAPTHAGAASCRGSAGASRRCCGAPATPGSPPRWTCAAPCRERGTRTLLRHPRYLRGAMPCDLLLNVSFGCVRSNTRFQCAVADITAARNMPSIACSPNLVTFLPTKSRPAIDDYTHPNRPCKTAACSAAAGHVRRAGHAPVVPGPEGLHAAFWC